MRNEFEKQVQQKMEELDFVPSPPVWEKVEAQIRQKKDRRRMFIWLPSLCLLLIIGIWWLNDADEKNNTSSNVINVPNSPVVINAGENEKDNINSGPTTKTGKSEIISNKDRTNKEKINEGKPIHLSVPSTVEVTGGRNERAATKFITKKSGFVKSNTSVADRSISNETSPVDISSTDKPYLFGSEEISLKYTESITPIKRDANNIPSHINGIIHRPVIAAVQLDSNLAGIGQPSLIRKNSSKWKFGATAALGISKADNGLNFFDDSKSLDAAAPLRSNFVTPLLYNNADVSNVPDKDISFSTGVVARKQIGKKLNFSTGIGYHYFSTKTFVGVAINQANAVQGSTLYYINYGVQKQEYHNQYHFVSIPVGLDLRVLQNFPLQLYAGMSVKYLVKTNALQFNNQSQAYYFNKQGFKRTQLFSNLGLQYAFLKDQSLIIGPQIEYGFSKLDHSPSPQHLYAYVLKAQWIFIKN